MTQALGLILAAVAWAGPVEVPGRAVAAVQLSLDLQPASARAGRFEAIEAISQIPGAEAPALPAPVMPEAAAAALRGGDALAFYRAAEAAGYVPPQDDDRQQALLDEGAARAEADRDFERLADSLSPAPAAASAPRGPGGKLDYAAFGSALRARPGLSDNLFQHADAKREILRAAGYTHLRGRGKTSVTLDEASDARVGHAFSKVKALYRQRH